MLLSVLYDTGARVQEIADLQVRDVRLLNPASIKLTGKGNKSRLVPLVPQTAKMLKAYLEERRLTRMELHDVSLFYNKMRSKLTRSGIAYILDKYVAKARDIAPHLIPDKITPHCLRHSKAMHLLQAGVNLIYVRDFLGHADIQTTEIYARADTAVKRKALENAYQEVGQTSLPIWQQDTELLGWLQNLGKEY